MWVREMHESIQSIVCENYSLFQIEKTFQIILQNAKSLQEIEGFFNNLSF
jgi:hypothetical protein